MPDEPSGADVAVEIAGQKVNLRNIKSLNTLATIATLLLTGVIGFIVFTHSSEAKDGIKEIAAELKASNKESAASMKESNKELGEVLKEMARAARETNCLLAMPPEKRIENVELCKRLSR
ncbi:MAG: hypothetical protein WAW75_04555 [Gallionella sp.]